MDGGLGRPGVALPLELLELQDREHAPVAVEHALAFQERLPLDRAQGERLRERVHEDVGGHVGLDDEDERTIRGAADGRHHGAARRVDLRLVSDGVPERHHRGQPVGLARVLLHDAESPEAAQHDVRPPVRQRLMLLDPARAPVLVDGRTSVVVVLPSCAQQRHADDARPGQRVRDHLAVAGLEDVERKGNLRKEDDVREREQRNDRRNGGQESSGAGAQAVGRREAPSPCPEERYRPMIWMATSRLRGPSSSAAMMAWNCPSTSLALVNGNERAWPRSVACRCECAFCRSQSEWAGSLCRQSSLGLTTLLSIPLMSWRSADCHSFTKSATVVCSEDRRTIPSLMSWRLTMAATFSVRL